MDIDSRVALYKENYQHELDHKDKLYTRLAAVAVVFTACLSTLGTNITDLNELNFIASVWLMLFFLYGIFCLCIFIFYSTCFIHAKWDELVASSTKLENYHSELVNYYDENKTEYKLDESFISSKMSDFLASTYAFASTRNYDNNVYRLHCLNRLYTATIAMVIITFLATAIVMYHKTFNEEEKNDGQTITTIAYTANYYISER